MSSASLTNDSHHRRLHRGRLRAFLKGSRRARLAGRAPPGGVRPLPGVRLAQRARGGMAADRYPRPEAGRIRAAPRRGARRRGPRRRSKSCGKREHALCHRHRPHQRRPCPRARPGEAGRCGFRRSGPRGQRLSGAPRAILDDRGRHPGRRHLRRPALRVLDRRDAALCAQGRHARRAAIQPGRTGAGGACRPGPHPGRARGRGRGHPGPRDERAAAAAKRRGSTSGALEVFLAAGSAAPAGEYPELGRRHLALQPRAGDRRPRRSLQWTVGGLGSRLAKVNQEVVLAGPGAEPRSTA